MPYAMIACVLGVFLGGLLGWRFRKYISDDMREMMPRIIALTSMGSGIVSVTRATHIFMVTMAIILGGFIGRGLHLEERVRKGLFRVLEKVSLPDGFDMERYITITAVFCTSGFGLYAVMVESFSGDHAQMISKAIMDSVAALLFGSSLGMAVSLIAIPQGIIFVSLFFLAKALMPVMTEPMEMNFIACGGLLTVAAGMRMAKIKEYPLIDMLPALVLVMPLTNLWLALAG